MDHEGLEDIDGHEARKEQVLKNNLSMKSS